MFGVFHVRDEGEVIRPGFNFYPLKNKWSRGFVFRWSGRFQFCLRYSLAQERVV